MPICPLEAGKPPWEYKSAIGPDQQSQGCQIVMGLPVQAKVADDNNRPHLGELKMKSVAYPRSLMKNEWDQKLSSDKMLMPVKPKPTEAKPELETKQEHEPSQDEKKPISSWERQLS